MNKHNFYIFMLLIVSFAIAENDIFWLNDSAVTIEIEKRISEHVDTANISSDSLYKVYRQTRYRDLNSRQMRYLIIMQNRIHKEDSKELHNTSSVKTIQWSIFAVGLIGGFILWLSPYFH